MHVKKEDGITPWGEGANLGNLEHKDENKPKRKYTRKNKIEQNEQSDTENGVKDVVDGENDVAENKDGESVKADEKAAENVTDKASVGEQKDNAEDKAVKAEIESKPKIRLAPKEKRNPWDLSATTLNQKYTLPSGKNRTFDVVDEDKVGVGGITFADGSGIVDPFGDELDISAKPEIRKDEE